MNEVIGFVQERRAIREARIEVIHDQDAQRILRICTIE